MDKERDLVFEAQSGIILGFCGRFIRLLPIFLDEGGYCPDRCAHAGLPSGPGSIAKVLRWQPVRDERSGVSLDFGGVLSPSKGSTVTSMAGFTRMHPKITFRPGCTDQSVRGAFAGFRSFLEE